MCQVEGTFARFDKHQCNMSEATGNQTTVCLHVFYGPLINPSSQLNPVKIMSDFKQVSDDFAKASTEYTKVKESVLNRTSSLLKDKEDLLEEINSQLSQLKK